MRFKQSTDSIASFRVQTAQPFDVKAWFDDEADMQDVTVNNDPEQYFDAMIAKNCETGNLYRWIETSGDGVIVGGYTYAPVYEHDGIDYGGKTYNFVAVGQYVEAYALAAAWPPTVDYPLNTIVLREYVDVDTYVGIYRKTTGGLPGAWTLLFRTSHAAMSNAAIQAVVEAMFITPGVPGPGGDEGVAGTVARGDHAHDVDYMPIGTTGLIFKGDILTGENMDNLDAQGLYQISDGSLLVVPAIVNGPVAANLGYIPNANNGFWVKCIDTRNAAYDRYQEVGDMLGMPLCFRYRSGGGVWSAWFRFEATQSEVLAGTAINKHISPANLRNHESFVSVAPASYVNGWTSGSIQYRMLTNSLVEIKISCSGNAATNSLIYTIPTAKYWPSSTKYTSAITVAGGTGNVATVQILTDGRITITTEAANPNEFKGVFNGHFFYSID